MCRHIYLPIVQPVDTRHWFSCPLLLSIVFFSFPRCLVLHLFPPAYFSSECASHLLPCIFWSEKKEREKERNEGEGCVFMHLCVSLMVFCLFLLPHYHFLSDIYIHHSSHSCLFPFSPSICLFFPLNATLHKCWHSSSTPVLLNCPFGKSPALIKGILETNKKQKPEAFHPLPLWSFFFLPHSRCLSYPRARLSFQGCMSLILFSEKPVSLLHLHDYGTAAADWFCKDHSSGTWRPDWNSQSNKITSSSNFEVAKFTETH